MGGTGGGSKGPASGGAWPDLSARPTAEVARELGADLGTGLASAEAAARLARHGRNEVAEERAHPVRRFLHKFWGPSAWMIELVVAVSLVLHRAADAALGATLLAVNAVLGALQEQRASAVVEALRSRLRVSARVRRDASWSLAPASELVPGDVVRLRAGDFVPADAKIAEGRLAVDQSALTGESAAADKGPDDLVYSGSMVRRGEATALVILTGARTYYGRTTALVAGARPRLHVEEVVARVVRWLFVITGALTALALVVARLRGLPLLEILPLLLLLLLSAVPVALPVMFTVSMAVGARELSRRGVLVTRLSAAEDAATMDVLCADKTGTITENRLRVAAVRPEPGFTEEEVLRLGAMASEESDQDPIDVAFAAAARERGLLGALPRRLEFLPFSAETRRTEAVFEAPGGRSRVVKGALRTVAAACQLPPGAVSALEAGAEAEAARGRRALAVARSAPGGRLELAGLALLHDAPRRDSPALIAQLRELGVQVKMLTGDALPVAREVARSVGLGEIVRAASLREELGRGRERAAALAAGSEGFAEVFPEDKYAVVEALQAAGHVVGMTGDGVNDAPALRQAEVGIAVSSAVDVAKAAASVVLTEEGLTGIVQLVRNGRVVYQRVLTWIANKVSRTVEKSGYVTIAFLVTGRFVVSTFGMILLLFMTDFVKIALATDRMQGGRRPETWRIGPWVRISAVLGALMLAENLALLALGWRAFGLGADLAAAQTFSFQALLYFALFSIVSVRERSRFWRSAPSGVLLAALAVDAAVGAALPLADLPGLRPIPAVQTLAVVAAAALLTLGLNDAVKVALVRRAGLAPAAGTGGVAPPAP
ncbi:MAG TPA: plasma-membrane proton-efflux P-type ATPase [Anaeromyxobacteraceae bacterium]|nr:plasma-membrane proton-efflux P-type ATPase [Anaeromyxobacteraceae bacterium]